MTAARTTLLLRGGCISSARPPPLRGGALIAAGADTERQRDARRHAHAQASPSTGGVKRSCCR